LESGLANCKIIDFQNIKILDHDDVGYDEDMVKGLRNLIAEF